MNPNKENIRKWVDALRSGEFNQTRSRLRDNSGMCCLGVACEVFRRETGHGDWKEEDKYCSQNFIVDGVEGSGAIPNPVASWFGFERDDGLTVNPTIGGTHAAYLNDVQRLNFSQIADLIEKEWLI